MWKKKKVAGKINFFGAKSCKLQLVQKLPNSYTLKPQTSNLKLSNLKLSNPQTLTLNNSNYSHSIVAGGLLEIS